MSISHFDGLSSEQNTSIVTVSPTTNGDYVFTIPEHDKNKNIAVLTNDFLDNANPKLLERIGRENVAPAIRELLNGAPQIIVTPNSALTR